MVGVAIGGAALIGGAATVAAGSKAAKAAKKGAQAAADAQERAAQLQVEEARRQYDTTRADYAPYRNVGYGALGKLAGMYGVRAVDANGKPIPGAAANTNGYGASDFETSPGYQFRLDEGQKAIERSAAARGMLGSGGTLKALTRYAQGVASDEYNNYANRLAALAGVGQSATGSTANAGQAASNAIGNAYGAMGQAQGNAAIAAGNARASSYANLGSAINSGVNNLASLYLYQQGGGFGGGFGGATTSAGTPPIYGGNLGGIY
jgi:hypothetical protein